MKQPENEQLWILLADDDEDDRLLIREAFEEQMLGDSLFSVEDGEELMDLLRETVSLTGSLPELILLDLNMPRKSGFEVLTEIRSDNRFRRIPVVILTTSKADQEIRRSYELGANSYIVKPAVFEDLVVMIGALKKYWFRTVELPGR